LNLCEQKIEGKLIAFLYYNQFANGKELKSLKKRQPYKQDSESICHKLLKMATEYESMTNLAFALLNFTLFPFFAPTILQAK